MQYKCVIWFLNHYITLLASIRLCPVKMQAKICTENYQLENKHICPKEVSNKLDQSIDKIIEKTGFTKYNVEKRSVCTNGGNYAALLYEIDIKGKTKEGGKELNIFVKSVIPGESNLQILSLNDIFITELFTYKEVSKIFEELQGEAKVPIDERFKMVKSYEESVEEMIIMENVSKKGFTTGHRMDVVSLKFAELAIQELAKFHAFTFVLKQKRPDFFENQVKAKKAAYNFGEQWRELCQSLTKIAMNNIDEGVKAKVEKFSKGIGERFQRYYDDETAKRCLCHGDYKPSNILMKKIDGEVSEILPVDYQLVYYGCPIVDFLYFIFTSTDQEFRRAHLTHLKGMYYKTMMKFLTYFDIDVNSFYPRNQFEKEYKKKLDYGLCFSLTFLAFTFVREDDVPDLSKYVSNLSFKVDDKYKVRIQGIVDDYIEWGVI